MTTTLQSHGGGAQPASIDTSGKVTGGTALRVYGFDSAEAAHAAGYVCEGGPAMSVALITDAQIASGAWKAEGDPSATIIYTAPSSMPVEGGYAVPIYAVNGWGSSPTPPAPSGPVPILDLEADTGATPALWSDQSGHGNNFAQSDSAAQPTIQTVGGYPAVVFDGVDDQMVGPNFADNLTEWTIIFISALSYFNSGVPMAKDGTVLPEWDITIDSLTIIGSTTADQLKIGVSDVNDIAADTVVSIVKTSNTAGHLYLNGSNAREFIEPKGNLTNFSNSQNVLLCPYTEVISLRCMLFYDSALSDSERSAKELELATRYGITL